MAKEKGWQAKLRERVAQLPNKRLVEELMGVSPDLLRDDGNYTRYSGIERKRLPMVRELLQEELDRRLRLWYLAGRSTAGVVAPAPARPERLQRRFALDEAH